MLEGEVFGMNREGLSFEGKGFTFQGEAFALKYERFTLKDFLRLFEG